MEAVKLRPWFALITVFIAARKFHFVQKTHNFNPFLTSNLNNFLTMADGLFILSPFNSTQNSLSGSSHSNIRTSNYTTVGQIETFQTNTIFAEIRPFNLARAAVSQRSLAADIYNRFLSVIHSYSYSYDQYRLSQYNAAVSVAVFRCEALCQ